MEYRFKVWPAVSVAGLLVFGAPVTGVSQSRGTSPEGADSSYFSGSAASGHHGTSGSAEDPRHEDAQKVTGSEVAPSRPAGSPSDERLRQRIREALQDDRGFALYADGISIDVDGGEVTLRGPVKTEKDKADIAALARRVAGVTEIHNQLQVAPNLSGSTSGSSGEIPQDDASSATFQRQSGTARPGPVFYQPIGMREYGPASHSRFEQNFSSSEILTQDERDLVERVAANVAIDPATAGAAQDVTISAEQGVVTLHGPVPTERDRDHLVTKVADIPGVVQVQDELRVTGLTAAEPSGRTARETTTETGGAAALAPPSDLAVSTEERRVARSGGFPATQSKRAGAADDKALIGSGQMHEEDRTGTTGPSGSRTTSPMDTGAVDGVGRAAKNYGDYAVTTNDRALISQVRMALIGNPEFQATEENLHLKADNGTVHLHGWVSSEQARDAMAATVKDVAGVQGVVNHLQVRPATIGTVR